MKKWTSVDVKLPKIKCPVLCIVRTTCECVHYVPAILARFMTKDDDWDWLADNPSSAGYVVIPKKDILAWKSIDPFPTNYPEGFGR